MAYTEDTIAEWIAAAAAMHANIVTEEVARDARHASATAMSGSGFLNAPTPILEMFNQLIEVGYAHALLHKLDEPYA